MDIYHKILLKYWGHSSFRPLQEEIIASTVGGNDTLALMPTGGGKSITFQVSAMSMEGICLVVTPLLALMKDQVENLRRIGIKALSVHSGMTAREIDVALNNAIYGDYKFLYLSPERLETEILKVRVRSMKVNILVVDEAHCISQWGYDFRPSYLKIAEIRELLPSAAPVLALTATATPKVVDDIMEKLRFRKPNLLKKSFERKNLVYIVRDTEDKFGYLLKILNKEKGSGIVYVRSRGGTKEIATKLVQNGISADFYHAGLSPEMRNKKQDDWKSGKTKIIVATNAFGMGIDKADVKVVVHVDLPESLEAYFQEAGRAGRNEGRAYAVLLYNRGDKLKFEQHLRNEFPPLTNIKAIYQGACNYAQIPYGAGKGSAYEFSVANFSYQYKYFPATVYSAFKFLRRENLAELTEEIDNPSRIMFLIGRDDLYKIQVKNPAIDKFIKILLRAYPGLFNNYVNIDENYLALLVHLNRNEIYETLLRLSRMKILSYIPSKHSPMLIMHEERLEDKNIRISNENYEQLKKHYVERMEQMLVYAQATTKCRSIMLLEYFGETGAFRCGQCDVCMQRNELELSKYEFDLILDDLKSTLKDSPRSIAELIADRKDEAKTIKVIRWLIDNGKIIETKEGKLLWK
ncbi:MAG: RecQ family ATP-dependent DNA helicase [Prevotellaceae bacterium]|jgi:ATP-dependent DNA helicase RecQ|nr:RecQ family ATP-dependent DNA helicase [Prevotellaceae bacterium]